MSIARRVRIGALLLILAAVAYGEWHSARSLQRWQEPLWVGIYPIAADDSDVTARWIDQLGSGSYADAQAWLGAQAAALGLKLDTPFRLVPGDPIGARPPKPPDSGALAIAAWSLKMRAWSRARLGEQTGPRPEIALYMLYHDPERIAVLPHSLGLTKGRFGIVHAFADPTMRGSNHVVLAHELLHVVGATDKYDLSTGLPRFPDGYAEPARTPRYPQEQAEIMGGRIPISATQARIPASLGAVIMGPASAAEIGWMPAP